MVRDEILNSTVNSEQIKLTVVQEKILNLLINNPEITIEEIAEHIGKDRNAVNYQLKKMKTYIKIERIGSDKKGQWNVEL